MVISELFDNDGELSLYCWQYVLNLCYLVANRYYRNKDKEDLVSVALPDVISFIRDNKDNQDIRNVRSFIFTRIRNIMSNYLYRYSKEEVTPEEDFQTIVSDVSDLEFIDYKFDTPEEARMLALDVWEAYERAW